MLRFEYTEVAGIEAAIRGMRNASRSKGKGDSFICNGELSEKCDRCGYFWSKDGFDDSTECHYPWACHHGSSADAFILGQKDTQHALRLIAAGPDRRTFLQQMQVWVDITGPVRWWSELRSFGVVCDLDNPSNTLVEARDRLSDIGCFSWDETRTVNMDYGTLRRIYHAWKDHEDPAEWRQFCDWVETLPESELITV